MPVECEIPLPEGGAMALFERLRDLPRPVLLHSGTDDGSRGRWDILSAAPTHVLTLGGAANGTTANVEQCRDGDALLARARQLLATLPASGTGSGSPFSWGLLGYLGYESLHHAFGVAAGGSEGHALPTAVLALHPWSVRVDRRASRAWFASAHEDADAGLALARLTAPGKTTLASTRQPAPADWLDPPTQGYARGFEAVQAYLLAGDSYQVNLARHFRLPWSDDPWPLFRRLCRALPAAFSAYMELPEGAVLCCSPERLLRVLGREACSQPIKGTARRADKPEDDQSVMEELRNSPKDRAENVMITDLVRNDLGRVATPGSVRVEALFAVRTLPTVHHLESTVTARLRADVDALDALRACFPAGSITGAPKRRAMQIIAELEPDARSVYCGSIGYVDAGGNCDFNVAIRTLTVDGGMLRCWGGGGIVVDSKLPDELREIDDKVGALRAVALGENACAPPSGGG